MTLKKVEYYGKSIPDTSKYVKKFFFNDHGKIDSSIYLSRNVPFKTITYFIKNGVRYERELGFKEGFLYYIEMTEFNHRGNPAVITRQRYQQGKLTNFVKIKTIYNERDQECLKIYSGLDGEIKSVTDFQYVADTILSIERNYDYVGEEKIIVIPQGISACSFEPNDNFSLSHEFDKKVRIKNDTIFSSYEFTEGRTFFNAKRYRDGIHLMFVEERLDIGIGVTFKTVIAENIFTHIKTLEAYQYEKGVPSLVSSKVLIPQEIDTEENRMAHKSYTPIGFKFIDLKKDSRGNWTHRQVHYGNSLHSAYIRELIYK